MANPVPILMYHYLGNPPTAEDRPYHVAPETFDAQLDLLRAAGYTTVDLIDLADHLESGVPLPERPLVLTFDNGHTTFHGIAAGALARAWYTATVFAITGRVGQSG